MAVWYVNQKNLAMGIDVKTATGIISDGMGGYAVTGPESSPYLDRSESRYPASYDSKSGKRTVRISRKEKGATDFICNPLILMVGQDRIELSTHGFSVRCSTD